MNKKELLKGLRKAAAAPAAKKWLVTWMDDGGYANYKVIDTYFAARDYYVAMASREEVLDCILSRVENHKNK